MANQTFSIRIKGLRELASAFKQVGAEAPLEMKTSLRAIIENIAAKIRGKFPRLSGKAAGSVKSQSSPRGGSISFGGTSAPHTPWLDFGGSVGRGHRPGVGGSGAIKRPFIKSGRYVYPTISEEHATTERAVEEVIMKVARDNGFGVR